jgi:Formyl transferase
VRLAIISEADLVWALSAWERTIPLLLADGHEIVGVWTCSAALAKLRGKAIPAWYLQTFGVLDFIKLGAFAAVARLRRLLSRRARSFKSLAVRYGVTYGECRSPNDPSFCEWLGTERTDILLVTVSLILGEKLLGVPRLGTINKHAALLPANRGLFPYFWAKLHATAQGISYHLVTPGIDEGPLLVQDRDVPATSLGTMVRFYLHVFGTFPERMRAAVLMLAASTTLAPLPGIGASYYGQPSRAQVADFRRAGGHIISITDIARAWAL